MKRLSFTRAFTTTLVLAALLLYACQKSDSLLARKAAASDHFISQALAMKIAGKLTFNEGNPPTPSVLSGIPAG